MEKSPNGLGVHGHNRLRVGENCPIVSPPVTTFASSMIYGLDPRVMARVEDPRFAQAVGVYILLTALFVLTYRYYTKSKDTLIKPKQRRNLDATPLTGRRLALGEGEYQCELKIVEQERNHERVIITRTLQSHFQDDFRWVVPLFCAAYPHLRRKYVQTTKRAAQSCM